MRARAKAGAWVLAAALALPGGGFSQEPGVTTVEPLVVTPWPRPSVTMSTTNSDGRRVILPPPGR